MIVSHKHKFVFVKIPKTAGETLVTALREYIEWDLVAPPRGNHEKLKEIKGKLDSWEEYFKFTFVRNPWDLRVSRFFYLRQIENPKGMSEGVTDDI